MLQASFTFGCIFSFHVINIHSFYKHSYKLLQFEIKFPICLFKNIHLNVYSVKIRIKILNMDLTN